MTDGHPVELLLPDGAVQITVRSDESVWDAARRNSIELPSMCLQGWCLTCAGQALEGDFDPAEALRYYPADKRAGFILLCTARPCSRMRIRTHQKEAMQRHRREHRLPTPRG